MVEMCVVQSGHDSEGVGLGDRHRAAQSRWT